MKKSNDRIMTGSAIRALCVAGVFAISAGAATPGIAASNTLDLNSYTTAVDHSDASRARVAGQFDLGLPVQLPTLSYGPQQVVQISNLDSTGSLPLIDGVSLGFGTGADLAGKFETISRSRTRRGFDVEDDRRTCPLDLLIDNKDLLWLVFVKTPRDRLARSSFRRHFVDPCVIDPLIDNLF